MTKKEKLKELNEQLARARYGQAGMFPHPGWFEEEERILKEIKELENGKEESSDPSEGRPKRKSKVLRRKPGVRKKAES